VCQSKFLFPENLTEPHLFQSHFAVRFERQIFMKSSNASRALRVLLPASKDQYIVTLPNVSHRHEAGVPWLQCPGS
jgi:hypothetical protein